MNTDVYLGIFEQGMNQLDDCELMKDNIHQDEAMCHTLARSMAGIEVFFGNRVISKGLLLLGYGKGFRNKPCAVEDLKENIQLEIGAIPLDMLDGTFRNMEHRGEMCLAENGDHFQRRFFFGSDCLILVGVGGKFRASVE